MRVWNFGADTLSLLNEIESKGEKECPANAMLLTTTTPNHTTNNNHAAK